MAGLRFTLLAFAAAHARRLPSAYEPADDLVIHDGRRRRLNIDNIGRLRHRVEDHLQVSFSTPSRQYAMDLYQVDVWATASRLIVNEGGQSLDLAPPHLPVYRGHLANQSNAGGGVSGVVLADGTLRVHVYEDGEDAIFESTERFEDASTLELGSYIVYRTTVDEAGAEDEVLHHSAMPRLGVHLSKERQRSEKDAHRRLSLLNTLPTGPPYGRLSSCPAAPSFYTNKIGIVVDHGFASAVGGTTSAVTSEVASIIVQTNVIFADQVGIEFLLGTLVVNLDASATLADGGPNFAPTSSGTRTCGGDLDEGYTSRTVPLNGALSTFLTVEQKGGPDKLLGHFSNWIGLSAPTCSGCSHWHLMTDCFPPAGTVGIAFQGVGCNALTSRRGVVSDSGTTCSDCDVRLPNGNAANLGYLISGECQANEWLCAGPVALTSYSAAKTWRTFAHEIGHIFDAQHTFGLGGLMDYNEDPQFYDNGEVCRYVNGILAGESFDSVGSVYDSTCLATGNAVCGDGSMALGGGEECDDGNTDSGDGCSSTCALECGFVCTEDSNRLTTCTKQCGNGVVDRLFNEECDDTTACCTSDCKLAPGAQCSGGGDCCTPSCKVASSSTSCTTSAGAAGYCGANGECSMTGTTVCALYGLSECEKGAGDTCKEHCIHGGTCYALATLVSPSDAPDTYLSAGRPCVTSSGAEGVCDDSGTCVSAATCGNGVVEAGEECDDTSKCCSSSCTLETKAQCSGGDCCSTECAYQPASQSCGGGGGWCDRGTCVTSQELCTYILSGGTATVDTTTCPIGSSAAGNLMAACAHSCKRTSDSTSDPGRGVTGDCVGGHTCTLTPCCAC